MLVVVAVVAALAAAGITALLVNIIQRKTEAKQTLRQAGRGGREHRRPEGLGGRTGRGSTTAT